MPLVGFILPVLLSVVSGQSQADASVQANEASALKSIRRISDAEIQYNTAYPALGFTCSLSDLGGAPDSPDGPKNANLLDVDLASGKKAGYLFALTNCTQVTIDGQKQVTSFEITGVPEAPGTTGNRGFCATEFGSNVKYDPRGGTSCTELVSKWELRDTY